MIEYFYMRKSNLKKWNFKFEKKTILFKEEHDQKIARRRSSASHSSETDKDKAPAGKGKKPAQVHLITNY